MGDKLGRVALRTSLLYGLVGGLWILLSDRVLVALFSDPTSVNKAQTYKGWAYVAVTAWLLYVALRSQLRRWEQEAAGRRRAEEALRKSEEQYRAIFENALGGFFQSTPGGRFIRVNKALARMCGYPSPEEMVSTIHDIAEQHYACRQDREVFERLIREKGAVENFEHETLRKDGSTFWTSVSARVVRGDDDQVLYYEGTHEDIDQRKKAEKLLADAEEQYRSLFETSTNAIIIRNRDGRITTVNKAALILLGATKTEDLVGRDYLDFIHPEDRSLSSERVEQIFEIALGRHRPSEGAPKVISPREHRMIRLNGDMIPVESTGAAFYHRGDLFIQGIFWDITERTRAEEALRRSQSVLRAIVDGTTDAVYVKDVEGRYQLLNTTVSRVVGKSEEEVLGKDDTFLFPPDEAKVVMEGDRGVMESRATKTYEETVTLVDGKRHFYLSTKGPLLNSMGNVIGLFGIARDITEHKLAEEEMFRSKEDWERTFDAVSDLIAILDTEYRIVRVNRAMAARLGVTPEECVGLHCYDAVHGTSAPPLFCPHRQLLEDGYEHSAEMHEDRWGGDFLISVSPLRNREGSLLGSVHIVHDITERKRAEEELRQSQRRFETLSEATFEGIVISEAGRLVDANEQLARMLGYEPAELIGMEAAAMIAPEDRERVLSNIRSAIDANIEHGLLRKDGSPIIVEAHGRSVLYQGRQVRITAIRDITVRKQAEEEKNRLEAQLVQAQKMESIGRLAGGVAHDFNNMLGVIIGRVEMALDQVNPAESLHRSLREIQKAAHRSADLTRQLLAFARRQTVSPKLLDLNDTVSGMLKMLKRLIGEDIDLVWIPGHDLWKVRVDPSQIDQILANLTVNARDAISGIGSVTLRTENVVLDESYCTDHVGFIPGEYVLLVASDTGLGMTQEVLDHLFEPFFTTKEMGKGTGLGLATVYGIVKQNDGFIDVESELGKGTTLRIYLPRFETNSVQDPAEEGVQKPRGGTESILLVEDDEAILGLCREILETLGYKVVVKQTPSQAIRFVEEHAGDIHLLITDVVMPGMSGRELAERITAIKPGMKCLYMSGYTADMIAHRGVLDEGIHFIQKPFRPNDFAKAIREILEEK